MSSLRHRSRKVNPADREAKPRLPGTCASRSLTVATLLACLALPQKAAADDILFGLGIDNLNGPVAETTSFQLEYHSDPIRDFGWTSLTYFAVIQADANDDLFAGVGLAAHLPFCERWFGEASLAAGYYDAGSNGLDLGGHVQFRSLLGLGYKISPRSRISLAVDHVSNANLDDLNPGRNAVHLRYAYSF